MTPTIKLRRWLTPLALAAVLAAPARTLRAGAFTWAGQGDAWGAAGNWNPMLGAPPGQNANAGDTAAINSGPAIVLDINATLAGLTMNSAAASLTIPKSQTLTVNGPANLTKGRVFMTGGTIAGSGTLTVGKQSILAVQGNGTSTIQNTISLSGTLSIQSSGAKDDNGVALSVAKDLTNSGTIKFLNRIPATADDDAQVVLTVNGGKGTLTNSGTITFNSPGFGDSVIKASVVNSAGANITVEKGSYSVILGSDGAKSSNLGTISIAKGAALTLVGASFVNDKNGTSTGTIVGAGTLDRFSIPKGGWTNNGTIDPGVKVVVPQTMGANNPPQGQNAALGTLAPGRLTFVGDYVQSASGTLGIVIDRGGTAGTDYSQLTITQGAAYLDGQLSVTLTDPSAISYSDLFTVLTSDSGLSGSFANAPADSQGMSTLDTNAGEFTVLYLTSPSGQSEVDLTHFVAGAQTLAASVPEPESLVLGGIAFLGVAGYVWARGRRGSRT